MPPRESVVDARTLSKLKWRCRRGLLENDLFIERFFARHESGVTGQQASGLAALMELGDNDLLDLLLRRTEPTHPLDRGDVNEVLALLRNPPHPDTTCDSSTEKRGSRPTSKPPCRSPTAARPWTCRSTKERSARM